MEDLDKLRSVFVNSSSLDHCVSSTLSRYENGVQDGTD
jgi:hypothetical protein